MQIHFSGTKRLIWYRFEQSDEDEWKLFLIPRYYAGLFQSMHRSICQKRCLTEWKISKSGKCAYNFFKDLTGDDIAEVNSFLKAFQRYRIIGWNAILKPYFSNELDFCLALDKNYSPPVDGVYERTPTGELFKRAKYDKCKDSIEKLKQWMTEAVTFIPCTDFSKNICITYIPRKLNEFFYLPELLASAIYEKHALHSLPNCSLIESSISENIASMKNLPFPTKAKYWLRLIRSDKITISGSVSGKNVYIIDDLYQSGISMWSFAKYLKAKGAARVYGLVCVKAGKDTDNQ